jgi:quercetin dioxygenase-like cupin family protein
MIHSGHEFVFCISGQIEYEIENQKYILDEGDSLIFAAELRHRWRNIRETTATAIVVLAGFEPRERPSEYHITSGMKGE